MSTVISFILKLVDSKNTPAARVLAIALFLLLMGWGSAIVYARYSGLPAVVSGLTDDIITVKEGLKDINASLVRIEKNGNRTQRDIDELKNALISKR